MTVMLPSHQKLMPNQRLDFASLMLGFVAPLPFHPSPRSSSKAKQLG
ncbi:MAG: hypothetical protein WBE94_02960 [Pseudolabrys sp.]